MPNKYRMGGMPTDARGMNRNRPTAAGIAAAMRYWQQSFSGSRPPPDPQKETVDLAPTRPTAYGNIRQQQNITPTLMLATLIPGTYAALVANGAAVAGLTQLLPAVAVAIVSMIEGAR